MKNINGIIVDILSLFVCEFSTTPDDSFSKALAKGCDVLMKSPSVASLVQRPQSVLLTQH